MQGVEAQHNRCGQVVLLLRCFVCALPLINTLSRYQKKAAIALKLPTPMY